MIDSWTDLIENERAEMKKELLFGNQLCPNVNSILVEGAVLSDMRFSVHVKGTAAAIAAGYTTGGAVYSQEISRYF